MAKVIDDRPVLVTGSNGFVGTGLAHWLQDRQVEVVAIRRGREGSVPDLHGTHWKFIEALDADTNWLPLLKNCRAVVHLAARVHVMHEQANDPLAEFRRVNVNATERLARQAAECGVQRFVYLSSIKVNGEETAPGTPFRVDDLPNPLDAYARSKYEAEAALRRVEAETGLEVVIIRPPLVHGPNVKGNLDAMMRWLAMGVPLPFAAVRNSRSLVGLDNLCDLISICLDHPAAAGETFLVSDGQDVSTADLLRITGKAMERPVRLFAVPPAWIGRLATVLGKADLVRRLNGNLQVDISRTQQLLGWRPVLDLEAGIRQMVRGVQ